MSETRRFTAEEMATRGHEATLNAVSCFERGDKFKGDWFDTTDQMLQQAAESERVLAELREWVNDYSGAGGENMGVHAAWAEVRAILGRVKP